MILDLDYIKQQDLPTCEQLLKKALKNPDLDKELALHPHLHPQVDDIANTIAALEDRMTYLTQINNLEKANNARWGRTVVEQPQTPPPDEGFDD
jgi:hypothetical protein